jgi:hypothetical protein
VNHLAEKLLWVCIVLVCLGIQVQAADNGLYPLDMVLNLVPGFGLGSFITGDSLTGVTCALGELAGISLFILPDTLLKPPFDIPNEYTSADPMYGTYSYYSNRSMFLRSTGLSIFALSQISGLLTTTARYYGYSYDAGYLSYILPCFGVGAFLNRDLAGGLILLAANSFMAGQAAIGVVNSDINFIYGSLFLGILSGTYGALRYFDAMYNLNICLPVVLNLVPGLGVGSFIQGDFVPGFISLAMEGVGLGIAGAGFVSMLGASSAIGAIGRLGGTPVFIAGAALYVAGKAFSVFSAINYGFKAGGKQISGQAARPAQTAGGRVSEKGLFDGIDITPLVSILPAENDRFSILVGVNISR